MNSDWLLKNAWSLIIATITLISTYAIYGYRVTQLEAQAQETETDMDVVHQILQNIAVINTKVEDINADIHEIKTDVKELNKKIDE